MDQGPSQEHPSAHPPPPLSPAVHGHVQHPQHHQHSQLPDIDRRHYEQDTLAPMQDHYRQPPQHPLSPAHSAYHPYSSRDSSAVKRDTADDLCRPNSTGHAPDSLSTASHASGPQPPAALQLASYPPESQPRQMSYDNGSSVPPTPGIYRTTTFPPPTPSHQPAYEAHNAYPTETFYSVYSSVASAKKKNTRASQACDQCRQLKAKCDETKPCKTCRDKGTECRYRDPVPKATDKAQADILDGIAMMQSSLSTLADQVSRMNERMVKIETSFAGISGGDHVKNDAMSDDDVKSTHSPFSGEGVEAHYLHNDGLRDQMLAPTDRVPLRIMAEDEIEAEPGPPVLPGEPAIPMNHTTLAGLLLSWDSIKEMTKNHVQRVGIRHISEYPISQEQNRGQLIVYGRGEASHPSHQLREAPDHGQVDMPDDSSDMTSPSSGAADWGHLGGLSPAEQIDYRGGVLASDGNPDFSEAKVKEYIECFKKNILNMHPIVQPKVLDEWVRHFLDSLPRVQLKSCKPQASKTFAVRQPTVESTGSKRKRSPGPDYESSPTTSYTRAGKPERSIHNALILTILALGKVCRHRSHVPDALHHVDIISHGSPMNRNGIPPSPMQGSPPSYSSYSQSSGLASPNESDRHAPSRRSSIHGPGSVRQGYDLKKNYEVIPGLEYFALATDILGNHIGAYTNMKNVYANIFAGLYHGQLGRPVESFAFIHQAGHKLQVIMRPSLGKLRDIKLKNEFIQDTKYNQLALAFWTCLQLESDLIAELPLPPSGLLSYEEDMPHPNLSLIDGFDQRVLDSYPGQLYLRTHLNSIHRMFYAPDDNDSDKTHLTHRHSKFQNVELVADAVSGMNWVAPRFAFKEDDPPADNILDARLRGKYWGAQVITYRPFIRMILEFHHRQKTHPCSPNPPPALPDFREGIAHPTIAPGTRSSKDLDPKLIELARRGIKALIESTRAFHGLGEKRPIITSVFGTAHAQWGNVLVLAAAFKDPILGESVDEELLKTLLHKTIQFLKQSATATSSLRQDMLILQGLQQDMFPMAHEPRANSSFSSTANMVTPRMPMSVPSQSQHPPGDMGYMSSMSPQGYTSMSHGR